MKKLLRIKLGILLGILSLLVGLTLAPARAQSPGWQGAAAIGNSTLGTSYNGINATATDAAGNVYVTGSFHNKAVLNGAATFTSNADDSGFLAKWSPITKQFIWFVQFGEAAGTVVPVALFVNGADVYVAGSFTTSILEWGNTGVYVRNSGGANRTQDGFVAKLTDLGNAVSYSWIQRVGGVGNDVIEGLAVSGANVYLAGTFSSATATFGSTTLTSLGTRDGFVAKFTDAGASSSFGWVQQLGGTGVESAYKVAASNNNLYVTGTTTGTISLGSATITSAGGTDGFVAKLTDAGGSGSFGWVQQLQGAGNETVYDIAASNSTVYVAGAFTGTAARFGAFTLSSAGGLDGLVGRLNDAGSTATVAWVQRLGGPLDDEPIALRTVGRTVYVAGYFGLGSPVGGGPRAAFGDTQLQAVGGSDAFVARLNDSGSTGRFDWAQGAGGAGNDYANAVAQNGSTTAIAGFFTGANMVVGTTTLTNLYLGNASSFVASLTDIVPLPTRSPVLEQGLALYPNPARATAIVQVTASPGDRPAALSLFDATGRVVRTATAPAGQPYPLSLAGLAPGLYLLKIQVGEGLAVRQLVVE